MSVISGLLRLYLSWLWERNGGGAKHTQIRAKVFKVTQRNRIKQDMSICLDAGHGGWHSWLYLHGALEGVVVAGDVGHYLTLVGLLVCQQV